MRNNSLSANKAAQLALLLALAVLVGYVESLIPLNFGVPGIKPGLCNIVILIALLLFSWKEALIISAARVLIIGFLFGNLFSIVYGLAGTALSILVMSLLLYAGKNGLAGISAAGGIAHNMGQILIAKLVLPALPLLWYAPVLILAGMVTGLVVGFLAYAVYTRLPGAETSF